jgi:hypothetical protein
MPKKIGPYSQRELVPLLNKLVDDASADGKTAHRDKARTELRRVLEVAHWRTPYVLNMIAPRRCRYISGMGFWIDRRFMLTDWKARPGVDKPEVEA